MSEHDVKRLNILLKDHLGDRRILNKSVTRLTQPGENYGSLMLKVDVLVENGDNEETVHAVAKCIPPNKIMQDYFDIQKTFKKEMGWYTTVIPTYQDFQKRMGIEQVADFFPRLYGSRINLNPSSEVVDEDGVMLLENLIVQGYKNMDRRKGFDLPVTKALLKLLATFHAIPLAIKLKDPELFKRNIEPYLCNIDHFNQLPTGSVDAFLKFIETDRECAPFLSKVQATINNNKTFGTDNFESPWGTIVHNDFWVNNMMVKEGNGIKIKIVDFQVSSHASALTDLVFFILTSVQTVIIKKYFDELIHFYYEEFISNLKELGIDTTDFTFSSFEEELNRRAPEQFLHIITFLMALLAEKENTQDPTKTGYDVDKQWDVLAAAVTDNHRDKYKRVTLEYAEKDWFLIKES